MLQCVCGPEKDFRKVVLSLLRIGLWGGMQVTVFGGK